MTQTSKQPLYCKYWYHVGVNVGSVVSGVCLPWTVNWITADWKTALSKQTNGSCQIKIEFFKMKNWDTWVAWVDDRLVNC